MNKKYSEALEEIKTLRGFNLVELNNDENINKSLDVIERALQRLEAIENTNLIEALMCLEWLDNALLFFSTPTHVDEAVKKAREIEKRLDTIKQALLKSQEQEKENEVLKEIIKSFFDRDCPLHQYTDKEGILTIEVDDECSIMHLGEFKGVDLDKKLKEVLE